MFRKRIALIKLDKLPQVLLSSIASYLNQIEYSQLSKVNRQLYLGVHSPNNLQIIHFTRFNTPLHINFSLYPSVNTLLIDMHYYKNWANKINNTSFLNQLQTVTFEQCYKPNIHIMYNIGICRNVHTLSLAHWFFDTDSDSADSINSYFSHKFLCKFPNIKYLQLRNIKDYNI